MKLLPCVTSFVKDAAKAVKRISQQEFKEVADETLTELLGIATMVVKMYAIRREGEHEVLHLWCAHREEISLCTHCGLLSTKVHQEEHRCIRHLDVWGKKTFLHFLSRRFKCEQCGLIFAEELPFVDSHRRQSTDFEMHVYQACLSGTCKATAVREGLSHSTVKEIFNRLAGLKKNPAALSNTRVLGIDELSLKKRHKQFVLVISDIRRKCLLAVLPDREKKTLEDWIEALGPQKRKAIRFVSIDMWAPYYQAARSKLPHAKIVVDRFHVMKQLNTRLTQLRTKYQKQCTPEIQTVLKGSRWILVRNRSELSSEQTDRLDNILRLCPDLRTLYLLKEEFRTIFEKVKCRQKAARFLDAWLLKAERTGDKYLAKFLTTFRNWRNQILNYFIERITNGFVEGLNNALRATIRIAFGYRNFTNFKLRVLAEFSHFHVNPR
ncbi:MAG: ISL3 family transposase [Desulfobacteraceae bacterium]|nr:ISL3 family transposase [Desulfobacteraceae bacterium]